ncbi:MAG TPA: UbiA family prenyltransferase, partial [Actinotalea sp.]|nr:UbiA family prenyltransferase [Actinotalea sp.]
AALGVVAFRSVVERRQQIGMLRAIGYRRRMVAASFLIEPSLVAVLGTTYTQAGRVSWAAAAGAAGIGLLACALLMVNNVRDVPTDALVGKRTLAVRLGEHAARRLYAWFLGLALALGAAHALVAPWSLLVLMLALPAVVLSSTVVLGARGVLLRPVLAGTGLLELGYGVLLGLGLAL